jgi:hypothetical protein
VNGRRWRPLSKTREAVPGAGRGPVAGELSIHRRAKQLR